MAVVNLIGSNSRDLAGNAKADMVPGELNGGHRKSICGTAEIANGNSAASTILLGYIPSNARIDFAGSKVWMDAIAGVTDVDIGTVADPDCLMDGVDLHAGGAFNAVPTPVIANYDKPFYLLQSGVTADPLGKIAVYLTLKAAAGGAGTITWDIGFKTV